MSQLSNINLMTPKSSKITPITNATHQISSEVRVNTSLFSCVYRSWLKIAISLIAVGGILATVGIAVVSFVILRPAALSTTTTTSTTSTTTTTVITCFTIPSPRPSNVWLSAGNMSVSRIYHTSTLISQDNSVLIVGGSNGLAVSSVDRYISSTGCFQSMKNMPRTRQMHTADQLVSLSGYVVIAGGLDSSGLGISFADLYHPITAHILTIPLTLARYQHTSSVLSSSQLALIGGYTTGSVMVNTSDVLDTGSSSLFTSGINTMNEGHLYHTATLLGNNSDVVLITGGFQGTVYIATAYLYLGSSDSFLSLGSAATISPPRCYHTATYLPPPINKVLITGGADATVVYRTMFLFDVASLTLATLSNTLLYPRYAHTATLLPNGKVLIIGGYNGSPLNLCELIDPSNNYTVTWAGNFTTNRYLHTATLIPDSNNGTVLVCGGAGSSGAYLKSCELYIV